VYSEEIIRYENEVVVLQIVKEMAKEDMLDVITALVEW